MKKNILLLHSFLLLLTTPLSLLSMQKAASLKVAKTEAQLQKAAEKKQRRAEKRQQLTSSLDTVQPKSVSISEEPLNSIANQMPTPTVVFEERNQASTETPAISPEEALKILNDKHTIVVKAREEMLGDLLKNYGAELTAPKTLKTHIPKIEVPTEEQKIALTKLEEQQKAALAKLASKKVAPEQTTMEAELSFYQEKQSKGKSKHKRFFTPILDTLIENVIALQNIVALESTKEVAPAQSQSGPIKAVVTAHKGTFKYVMRDLLEMAETMGDIKKALIAPGAPVSELEQSVMVAAIPTKTGYGDLYRMSFLKSKNNLIFDAVVDGSFDPENETHTKMLEDALEAYIGEKNSQRVTTILECCQNHIGKMEINDLLMRKAHKFLETENKAKQAALKATLENKGLEFTTKRNALIVALQEETQRRITALNEELTAYLKSCDEVTEKEGNEIRKLKEGLTNIHTINTRLKLGKDEYCSDDEKYPTIGEKVITARKKIYTHPADVAFVYNNPKLLSKIEVDKSMQATEESTRKLLGQLAAINQSTQSIEVKRPALPTPSVIKQ